ncbi:MAG TPA: CapA family protein, partial [Microthrixaceae bacterium]|nr:CapA family protein [Microthrixaceae bacterium]
MARRTGPRWGRIAGLGLCAFVIGSLAGWIFGGADDATVSTADPTTTTLRADGGTDAPPSTGATSTTVDPAAPVRDQIGAGQPVTFVFGGDIHFDGPLATTLANAPDSILAGLQPTLSDADVAVVNLETAIGTGGTKAAKEFNFRASPAAFGALTSAGVDVIGMANNHALDYGQDGL